MLYITSCVIHYCVSDAMCIVMMFLWVVTRLVCDLVVAVVCSNGYGKYDSDNTGDGSVSRHHHHHHVVSRHPTSCDVTTTSCHVTPHRVTSLHTVSRHHTGCKALSSRNSDAISNYTHRSYMYKGEGGPFIIEYYHTLFIIIVF